MAKKIKSIDDYLNEDLMAISVKPKKVKKQKNKSKGKKAKVIALVLAGVIALSGMVTGLVHVFKRNKNNNNNKVNTPSISASTDMTLDDLGDSLEMPEKSSVKYGEVLDGNLKKEDIVKQDSKLYVNESAASKKGTVGNSSVDTKNDTLYVDPSDGNVKEKDKYYEVHDGKTGQTVESGKGDKSPNYQYDPELGKEIEKEEVGKNTYADQNYYGWTGDGTVWGVVIPKGTVMTKEGLERAKKELSTSPYPPKEASVQSNTSSNANTGSSSSTQTTKPSTQNSSDNTSSIETGKGVINPDGTYTIHDVTYRSYEDYQQYVLQGYTGYAIKDGIMMPEEEAKINTSVKVLTR